MSKFPTPDKWKNPQSKGLLKATQKLLNTDYIGTYIPFVVKRAKESFVYDYDGNKYIDFYLKEGRVILGYTTKELTKYVKNAVSKYLNVNYYTNLVYRVSRILKEMFPYSSKINIASTENSMITSLKEYFAEKSYKISFLSTSDVDIASLPEVVVITPIDFRKLEYIDISFFRALKRYGKIVVLDERITGNRVRFGISVSEEVLEYVDAIILGETFSNGYNFSAMVHLSNKFLDFSHNSWDNLGLSAFTRVVKFFRKKDVIGHFDILKRFLERRLGGLVKTLGSMFILKLDKDIPLETFFSYGIIPYNPFFLCYSHSIHNIRRFVKFIEGLL